MNDSGPERTFSALRRVLPLSALLARRLPAGTAARVGRVYPWGVALVYGGLAVAAHAADSVPPPDAIVRSALVPMSWAAIFVALAVSGGPSAFRSPADSVRSLATLRGVTPREERFAMIAGSVRAAAEAVGFPSLALAVVALLAVGGPTTLREGARLLGAVVLHAAAFGLVFGGLAAVARIVAPRHGRLLFAAGAFTLALVRFAAVDDSAGPLGEGRLVSSAHGDGRVPFPS